MNFGSYIIHLQKKNSHLNRLTSSVSESLCLKWYDFLLPPGDLFKTGILSALLASEDDIFTLLLPWQH